MTANRLSRASLVAGLALATAFVGGQPPVASPPPAPPPQWAHALAVTVIIGADVGVGADAELAPSPLLLRVDEPKRLRDIGSQSVECVFDALAHGNLAAERVRVKLSALRCFDGDGNVTLDRPVSGYVVDSDALAGAHGTVTWSQPAKDLAMLGAGSQTRQSILTHSAQAAISHATFGLGDVLFDNGETKDKGMPSTETMRELRSADTLLPALTIEPGHALHVVILGGMH